MNIKNLLEKLEKDYGHPWPNENTITYFYRIEMFKEIRKAIKQIDEAKNILLELKSN